jgi:hypothetical protein
MPALSDWWPQATPLLERISVQATPGRRRACSAPDQQVDRAFGLPSEVPSGDSPPTGSHTRDPSRRRRPASNQQVGGPLQVIVPGAVFGWGHRRRIRERLSTNVGAGVRERTGRLRAGGLYSARVHGPTVRAGESTRDEGPTRILAAVSSGGGVKSQLDVGEGLIDLHEARAKLLLTLWLAAELSGHSPLRGRPSPARPPKARRDPGRQRSLRRRDPVRPPRAC